MESLPTPPPEDKKPLLWPVAVNLVALVGISAFLGSSAQVVASTILTLAVVNLFAALLVSRFHRLNWVFAFLLSALLLPLIGFGVCAAYIMMRGGIHGGP